MSSKILKDKDLVLQDNKTFGFSLNTIIDSNPAMKGLKDLSVPAGLFFIKNTRPTSDYVDFTQKGEVINDALYDTLVTSAQPKLTSKKKKTKRITSTKSKKTRRK